MYSKASMVVYYKDETFVMKKAFYDGVEDVRQKGRAGGILRLISSSTWALVTEAPFSSGHESR
jgi:hypothetical protein